jgi:monoterpene epsilon-lactone hydrolase
MVHESMRLLFGPGQRVLNIVLGSLCLCLSAFSAATAAVDPSGAVSLPAVSIPYSGFASDEAHKQFVESMNQPSGPPPGASLEETRRFYDEFNSNLVERMRKLYAVSVKSDTIGGVVTDVITPQTGVSRENQTRVLINLHGGAFMWGARSGGLAESIPIAALGKIKVITVDYREAPEYHFPAASDDVSAVYSALLKTYRPREIGIYGCSAGGILTAESVAAFQAKGLPTPGAIGTFCGSVVDVKGDSSFIAPLLAGQAYTDKPLSAFDLPYFKGVESTDPLAFPGLSERILARFPPTLLITGSRDFAMSSVIRSQELFTKAHVTTELHIYDGMWHAFLIYPELPESIAAYAVIVNFFEQHLDR